jgi:hypothetical protein
MPISQEELNNLLSGKTIDGKPLNGNTQKNAVQNNAKYNILIPITISNYKKLPEFKPKLGLTTQDIKTKNGQEFIFNRAEVFKTYLRDYSKGLVEVLILGESQGHQIWQLLSGFDPSYIYVYEGNQYKEKHQINNWFEQVLNIMNPTIEEDTPDEKSEIPLGISIENKPEKIINNIKPKKSNILDLYLKKINGK